MVSSRNTSGELYGVQMLRAMAALLVVVHHTLEESNGADGRFSPDWITTGGASGVDLFFVISGFIMMYVTFKSHVIDDPLQFLKKRFVRIYPIYWLFCIAILIISAMGFLVSNPVDIHKLVSSFALVPGPKLLGVSWTLVYEVYFYIVFGAFLAFRSKALTFIVSTATIVIAMRAVPEFTSGSVRSFFSSYLPLEFCFGMTLGYVYLRLADRWHRWHALPAMAVFALISMQVAPLFVDYENTAGLPDGARVLAWGIPSALVLAGPLAITRADSRLARFMVLIGNASYSLYLSHQFVMLGYARALKVPALNHVHQLPVVILIVIVAVLIGLVAHVMFEKPLIRWMRSLPGLRPIPTPGTHGLPEK